MMFGENRTRFFQLYKKRRSRWSPRCCIFFCTPVQSPRRHALLVLSTCLFEQSSTSPRP